MFKEDSDFFFLYFLQRFAFYYRHHHFSLMMPVVKGETLQEIKKKQDLRVFIEHVYYLDVITHTHTHVHQSEAQQYHHFLGIDSEAPCKHP